MPQIYKEESCMSCKNAYCKINEQPCNYCKRCLDENGNEKEDAPDLFEEEE